MRYIATFGYHTNHIFDKNGKIIGIDDEKISNMILIYSLDVDADENTVNSIKNTKNYIESKLKKKGNIEVPSPEDVKKLEETLREIGDNEKEVRKIGLSMALWAFADWEKDHRKRGDQ